MSRWWQDPPLRNALLAGFFLRLVPMLLWIEKPCSRDECTYEEMAEALVNGDGIVGTQGWLWAPAYPVLMALHSLATGGYPRSIQVTQLAVALASIVMVYVLTRNQFEVKAARLAAWMYALNPTYVFYTTSQWSETIYGGILLGSMLALGWAREGDERRGWLPGMLVGLCVLFRGVATYILPIFLLGLLWGRHRERPAWRGAVALVLSAFLTVLPYSIYASNKFGALVVSDRTLGQMMYLGNNEFPPMTFDYGNGTLRKNEYDRILDAGRPHCPFKTLPVLQDRCEVQNGVAWIKANPETFLKRIPMRVAQMLNPESFLTRHLRWGRWRGTPAVLDEILIVGVVAFSFLTLLGGTLGYFLKGRGWYAITAGLIVLYHVAAIAMLAGLTRYRVPLEPLWLVPCATFLLAPAAAFEGEPPWRKTLAILVTLILFGFMLVYLPASWPEWRSW